MLLLGCSSGTGSVKKNVASTADPTNPFPEKILGHRVFLIFRSTRQNLLGYTMRPGLEKLQVFGAKYWQGKERPGRGPGENRTIVFNRKQARRVGAALPGIGFNNSYKGEVSFKLIFKGLRVSQLNVPVLEEEYRDLPEARTSPFVVSLLSADEVLIQALVKEAGGTRVGSRADTRAVFSGDVRYSESANGVIAGRKRIIGYILSRPRSEDLARRATGTGLRRLGIFNLKDRTGHSDFAFLSSTMRHKLEEAFQSIPKFHVVTDRKDDAKYHLKGSYSKIGSRVQFELSMRNTYNQKLEHKIVRVIKADNVDKLYDYQLRVVGDFARKFGVRLKDEDKLRLTAVVRQAKNLNRLKEFRAARALLEQGDFKKCEAAARVITEGDPEYLDAWLLHSECILNLSRYKAARPIVEHTVQLAEKANNPRALSRAYEFEGWYLHAINRFEQSLTSKIKGYEVLRKAFGENHPDTADYLGIVAWGRMLISRYLRKNPARKKSQLKQAEQDALRSLNVMKATFGPGDIRLMRPFGVLANIQMKQKKIDAGITNATLSLNLAKKHYGMKHPYTARRMSDLGKYYRGAKRYEDALQLYMESDRVYQRALGNTINLNRAIVYAGISLTYYKLEKWEECLKYSRMNLAGYKKVLGHVKNHSYIRGSRLRMGYAVMKANEDIHGTLKYWRASGYLKSSMPKLAEHLRARYWVAAENGKVPPGALAVGPDYNNKPLYACRVEAGGDVFFGKTRPAYGACNYARGGREVRARKYRVLVLKEAAVWEKSEGGVVRESWRILDLRLYPRKKKSSMQKPSAKKSDKSSAQPVKKIAKKPNENNGKVAEAKRKPADEILYLCRANYQGSTVIGVVSEGRANTCRFGYGGVAYGSANYQVLAGEKITGETL